MDLCGKPGSLKRFMLALLFIKATNGVADAVTVPYFKEIARQMADENGRAFDSSMFKVGEEYIFYLWGGSIYH